MATQGGRAEVEFAEEFKLFRDPKYRDFTKRCFDVLCPEHFWDRACSLSGKYHPKLSQGKGGLVRHVKYGVWWVLEIGRGFDSSDLGKSVNNHDLLISALLLHDVLKDGDPTLAHKAERQGHQGKRLIGGCHGVDMAQAIYNRVLNQSPDDAQTLICYGIAGHMGIWTIPVEHSPDRIEGAVPRRFAQLVHLGDYCASRQCDDFMLKYPPLNGTEIVPAAPVA